MGKKHDSQYANFGWLLKFIFHCESSKMKDIIVNSDIAERKSSAGVFVYIL